MNKTYIYYALVPVILASVSACGIEEESKTQIQENDPQAAQETSTVSEGNVADGQGEEIAAELESQEILYDISLAALAQKEIIGSDFTVGEVLRTTDAYTQYYITYKSGELTISGIMNVPNGDGPFPLLVLNHGYIDPAIYTNGRGLRREQDYLARQGYVIIHPDYRNHAQSDKDPDNDVNLRFGYVEDVIAAVKAAQNSGLAYIDGERVGLVGHSMGGGIVQRIIVAKPDLVDAVVLYAPVSSDERDSYEKWGKTRAEVVSYIKENYGEPGENPEFWDSVSARTYFDRVQVPVAIFHGTLDDSTPIEWSYATEQSLQQAGKDITLTVFEGEYHEFGPRWTDFMEGTTEFFDEHVKG
jgi:dipeptidyl aminopeptidase/acylaminoacyl peptidase